MRRNETMLCSTTPECGGDAFGRWRAQTVVRAALAAQPAEVDAQCRQRLAEFIMQFAGDAGTFFFAYGLQKGGQFPESRSRILPAAADVVCKASTSLRLRSVMSEKIEM